MSRKKRDPFVALVNPDGKIKSQEELFPAAQGKSLPFNIVVSAIIWDEKRPLAMINNKIYSEGKEIGELIIEKIQPNSVIVNDHGAHITIQLRRNEKK